MPVTHSRSWTIKANEATVKAARVALEIQDACNMFAVIGEMHRRMKDMRDANKADNISYGTDEESQHPVVIMFLDKLNSMARTQIITADQDDHVMAIYKRIEKAMDACERLQVSVDTEWQIVNPH